MDLFWLDKKIFYLFYNLSGYELFISTMVGYIGTLLLYGTFKNKKKDGKK